jgi:predicted enzyme related to lactoylglutathione lyase
MPERSETTVQANPVGWFEIPVLDMERAKAFYEGLFDIELQVQEAAGNVMAFWPMKEKGSGAAGALSQGEGYSPSQAGIRIYFMTDDVEQVLSRVPRLGGRVALPKTSIGEYGFIGHFIDTEGNLVSVHSMR